MNCRRGLQRVYLLLAVVWIAGISFALFSSQWQPWRATLPLWAAQNETLQASTPTPDSSITITPEVFLHDKATNLIHRQIWIWDVSMSIAPPLLFYGLLFVVVPWVYRGFRPGTQI
jgi:hypothetical protein